MNSLIQSLQSSSCRSNNQCRSFGRTQCLGNQFIFCFGQTRGYTLPGRCVNRSNPFCDVGSMTWYCCNLYDLNFNLRFPAWRPQTRELSLQWMCSVLGQSRLQIWWGFNKFIILWNSVSNLSFSIAGTSTVWEIITTMDKVKIGLTGCGVDLMMTIFISCIW